MLPLSSPLLSLRVQFNRSELMTEVVRDIDIMPADPYENLPLNIPLVPPALNGRPRPMLGVLRKTVMVGGGLSDTQEANLVGVTVDD